MPAPAIDLGNIIGNLTRQGGSKSKVVQAGRSVKPYTDKVGRVFNASSDFMFGVRSDRSLGKNLKGAAETLVWTAATGGVGKVVGKGVRAVRGARKATKVGKVAGSMKSGAAIKAKNAALAKSKAQATRKKMAATGKKMAATDTKYDKVYRAKSTAKKSTAQKSVAKRQTLTDAQRRLIRQQEMERAKRAAKRYRRGDDGPAGVGALR
jgi:uncharacterized protein with PIN domain